MQTTTVDLCAEAASRVQSAAFYTLKDLTPGQQVVLLTAEEPALMMRSLNLQLGHKLAWTVMAGDGHWRIEVRHRADAAPRDVFDLLMREHQRLDELLAQALRLLNQADIGGAAPLLVRFTSLLARHVGVENDVLAPFFAGGYGSDEPAAIMAREHADIAAQLAVIEAVLAQAQPDAGEASAFCAILAGTLAKHEHREENNVFPVWRACWARKSGAARAEMMKRVGTMLAGTAGGGGREDAG
jgi:uncharacterized protein (DUF2249 family)